MLSDPGVVFLAFRTAEIRSLRVKARFIRGSNGVARESSCCNSRVLIGKNTLTKRGGYFAELLDKAKWFASTLDLCCLFLAEMPCASHR